MFALVGLWLGLGTLFFYIWNLPDERRKRQIMTYKMSKEERDVRSACLWSAKYSNRMAEYDDCKTLEELKKKFLPHTETKESEERMMRCYRAAVESGRLGEFRWAMDLDLMEEKFLDK